MTQSGSFLFVRSKYSNIHPVFIDIQVGSESDKVHFSLLTALAGISVVTSLESRLGY